jgi:hypothetical protein
MDHVIEPKDEFRNEWSAPELKKIDIEEITAFGTTGTSDGFGPGS